MFTNPETFLTHARTLAQVLIGCCLVWHAAQAQTIDEITDLQRQKVLAELKRQVRDEVRKDADTDSLFRPPPISGPRVSPQPDAAVPPEVVAIFGVRSDSLVAVVNEPDARNVRMRVGDSTPGGWTVEKISSSAVTFTRPGHSNKAAAPKGKNKSVPQQPPSEISVLVAWGRNSQTAMYQLPPAAMGYPPGNTTLFIPAPLPPATGARLPTSLPN
jgi:type IV pilus biogenesis protein PilP